MKEIKSNGLEDTISQAIKEMRSEQGNIFPGKDHSGRAKPQYGRNLRKATATQGEWFCCETSRLGGSQRSKTALAGNTVILDDLLSKEITNSAVCLERFRQ